MLLSDRVSSNQLGQKRQPRPPIPVDNALPCRTRFPIHPKQRFQRRDAFAPSHAPKTTVLVVIYTGRGSCNSKYSTSTSILDYLWIQIDPLPAISLSWRWCSYSEASIFAAEIFNRCGFACASTLRSERSSSRPPCFQKFQSPLRTASPAFRHRRRCCRRRYRL